MDTKYKKHIINIMKAVIRYCEINSTDLYEVAPTEAVIRNTPTDVVSSVTLVYEKDDYLTTMEYIELYVGLELGMIHIRSITQKATILCKRYGLDIRRVDYGSYGCVHNAYPKHILDLITKTGEL